MSDIVERLRRMSDMGTTDNELLDISRAADEIERLRGELGQCREIIGDRETDITNLRSQLVKTRAALKPFAEVADEWDYEPASLEVELRAYDDRPCPGLAVDSFRAARTAYTDEMGGSK